MPISWDFLWLHRRGIIGRTTVLAHGCAREFGLYAVLACIGVQVDGAAIKDELTRRPSTDLGENLKSGGPLEFRRNHSIRSCPLAGWELGIGRWIRQIRGWCAAREADDRAIDVDAHRTIGGPTGSR